jgi:hypothetical protein
VGEKDGEIDLFSGQLKKDDSKATSAHVRENTKNNFLINIMNEPKSVGLRTGTRVEQVSVLTLLTSFCWEGRKRQKEKVQGGDGGGREDDEWRRQIEGWGKHKSMKRRKSMEVLG